MSREKFSFWLDTEKEEEQLIADTIVELKQERAFSRTVRDGIRLIYELERGNLDYLFELYPQYQKQLATNQSNIDNRLIDRLEAFLLAGKGETPSAKRHHVAEEEPIELELKPVSGSQAAESFLSSMLSLGS